MPIDFSQVKTITIPEGSVTKITDSNGNILWADDTKYPYRQLKWINFTGAQYCGLGSTWTMDKAYGFNIIREATDSNIEGILAENNSSYGSGGYICNIQTNSSGLYFTYKAGSSTSPNYVLNDYLPNNSKRRLWTYLSKNLIVLDVRDTSGKVLGNDEFKISSGTWPGSNEVIIGTNLKGIKIRSLTIANATISSGSKINVGTTTSKILPCQRKSDGKLGFYITSDNTFHPLSGTVTSANIGPTVDEYPDKMSTNS